MMHSRLLLSSTSLVAALALLGACGHHEVGQTLQAQNAPPQPAPATAGPSGAPTTPGTDPAAPSIDNGSANNGSGTNQNGGTTTGPITNPTVPNSGSNSGTTSPGSGTDQNGNPIASNPSQNGDGGDDANISKLIVKVHFAFNSAELRNGDKAQLKALAQKLATESDVAWVRIIGHSDRIGAEAYNKGLSKRRAESVRDFLTSRTRALSGLPIEIDAQGANSSTTDCPPNVPVEQQIECLQPDRFAEVTIEIGTNAQTTQP